MLNEEDTVKMQKLMEENPEFSEIINKLIHSYEIFISKMAHEIRNPLTLISSSLQLIQSQHPETSTYKHWNDIKDDIEFMKQLLTDLSSYTHSKELHIITFDFASLVKSSTALFEAELKKRTSQLVINCMENLPLIKGDPIKLRQVIINLLKNAYEAIDNENGVIHMDLFCHDNTIQLNITDNGCGISKEQESNLFTPFITYKQNGTGLGLAISRQIIESHHGSLTFTSIKNKGATFIVTLPIITSI